jgi:hypothetical protein
LDLEERRVRKVSSRGRLIYSWDILNKRRIYFSTKKKKEEEEDEDEASRTPNKGYQKRNSPRYKLIRTLNKENK